MGIDHLKEWIQDKIKTGETKSKKKIKISKKCQIFVGITILENL